MLSTLANVEQFIEKSSEHTFSYKCNVAAGEYRNGSCQCDENPSQGYKCRKILHVVVQLWILKDIF